MWGTKPSRLGARPGSQAPDPSSFLGLRLPRPTLYALLHAGLAHLKSWKNACQKGSGPRLSSTALLRAPRTVPKPGSRTSRSSHPVANFGASAAVGHVVPSSFSQTKSPVDPTLSQHQIHPEQRGRTQPSDQSASDAFSHAGRPWPLRQESPCPSAQSISSGEPVKRGHASTVALPQEATGEAARLD